MYVCFNVSVCCHFFQHAYYANSDLTVCTQLQIKMQQSWEQVKKGLSAQTHILKFTIFFILLTCMEKKMFITLGSLNAVLSFSTNFSPFTSTAQLIVFLFFFFTFLLLQGVCSLMCLELIFLVKLLSGVGLRQPVGHFLACLLPCLLLLTLVQEQSNTTSMQTEH